jgi:hypothetical protein
MERQAYRPARRRTTPGDPRPFPDQEPRPASGVLKVHDQVPGGLGHPRGGRLRGRAQDPDPAGRSMSTNVRMNCTEEFSAKTGTGFMITKSGVRYIITCSRDHRYAISGFLECPGLAPTKVRVVSASLVALRYGNSFTETLARSSELLRFKRGETGSDIPGTAKVCGRQESGLGFQPAAWMASADGVAAVGRLAARPIVAPGSRRLGVLAASDRGRARWKRFFPRC